MAIIESTASDSTYHSRHSKRTLGRAECIAGHIESPGSLLDVGCNNGITSAYMLDSGKAKRVTGIELLAATVEEPLKQHPDFTLLEGNVVDLELPETYDHIVYGAVHHHILNLFGLSAAIHTLQKLARHCGEHLFFETGQLGEGGRWNWQAPMRRQFRTDEEHFFYLLRSIEHMISGFQVIGSFWIHGIRRHYLRIDMRRPARRSEARKGWQAWPAEAEGPYVRSRGSTDQVLLHSDDAHASDSPSHFWIAGTGQERLFIKKHVHLPVAADAEWTIGEQVAQDWAVKPVARLEPDGALAFPYLADAMPIINFGKAPKSERRMLAAAVAEIFRDACEAEVEIPEQVLLSGTSSAKLIDVIDMHGNNFLVVRDNGRSVVRVVDFEQQSARYAPRNRMHVAKIFWVLGQRRLRAVVMFLQGLSGIALSLLRYEFVPFAQRVVEKQPSVGSLLVADFRTVAGKAAGRILRMAGLS